MDHAPHSSPLVGLALLGLLALARSLWLARPPPRVEQLGEALPLRIEALQGGGFRLLPGVGPVLAGRLEQARREAGGALTLAQAGRVPGVGPTLLRRWSRLGARAPPVPRRR